MKLKRKIGMDHGIKFVLEYSDNNLKLLKSLNYFISICNNEIIISFDTHFEFYNELVTKTENILTCNKIKYSKIKF